MLCSFTRWTVIPKKKKTTLACIFATITETVMNLSCHVGLDDASPCSPVISWWLGLREQLWHYKSLPCISIRLSCHCFTISLVIIIINRTGMTPLRYFTIPEPFSTLTQLHYSKKRTAASMCNPFQSQGDCTGRQVGGNSSPNSCSHS